MLAMWLQKLLVAAPFVYLVVVTVTCPCERLLACHRSQVLAAIALGTTLVAVALEGGFGGRLGVEVAQ